MPDTDEDIMRELMLRSTADLFAGRGATAGALRRQRQRRVRTRVLGVTGIAAAAGLAVGTLATGSGAAGPGARPAASSAGSSTGSSTGGTKAVQLTDAQRTLYGLSAAAAARPLSPAGRYVVLAEKSSDITVESGGGETVPKTSVIDTVTGSGVMYQDNTASGSDPQAPAVAKFPAGTYSTSAQLDAMPTDPSKLRAVLLVQAKQQLAQAFTNQMDQAKRAGKKIVSPAGQTGPTDDDLVFGQAADLLWQPNLSPARRAALYKVLADTPGVTVKTGVTDSAGRPAVEISRHDTWDNEVVETFENPQTGATLESAWVESRGEVLEDLYLSISYTNQIPANPYQG